MKDDRSKKAILVTVLSIVLIASVFSSGCVNEGEDEEYDLRVVVTIPPQREFVEEIGGDRVKVTLMVPPGESPHSYEPTTDQMREVSKADLYFKVGSGVEFEESWMDKIEENNPNMKSVDGSEGIELMGDDPHIWLSPVNAKMMVENILSAMKDEDPGNSEFYEDNAGDYISELETLHNETKEGLDPYGGREFLVYHPSFGYFAEKYNLTQVAIEEEGKEPGTQGLQAIIEQAKEEDIKVVFVSPQFDESNAQTIADEIGGSVITLNPMAEDYLENMEEVSDKLISSFEEVEE
ncbi:MAG: metal ABC transporter solute-binding protein, Zn/Mn family [Thermoplasmatota archaeon]